MITQEQHDLIVKALVEWYPDRPALLLDDQGNADLIFKGVMHRLKIGAPINAKAVHAVVDSFTKYREYGDVKGVLKYASALPNPVLVPVPAAPPKPAHNLPDADEPLLKGLRCLEDIAEKGAAISKKVLELGGHGVGGTRGALLDKLNRRLAFIQDNRIRRADLPPDSEPQQPQTVVQNQRTEDPRILAIREQIERESAGYTEWQQKKRVRLTRILNELLCEPSRQIYRDRSQGSIEVLRGLDAIEKLMEREIRDADNPIR